MAVAMPPLPATFAGDVEEKQVTLVRAHEDTVAPAPQPAPGPGHNLLSQPQRELLRTAIILVRRIQADIDRLNRRKSAAYDTLRQHQVDPALARKVVYRLSLTTADLEAIAERDAKLAAYWDAVSDLRVDEDTDTTDASSEP